MSQYLLSTDTTPDVLVHIVGNASHASPGDGIASVVKPTAVSYWLQTGTAWVALSGGELSSMGWEDRGDGNYRMTNLPVAVNSVAGNTHFKITIATANAEVLPIVAQVWTTITAANIQSECEEAIDAKFTSLSGGSVGVNSFTGAADAEILAQVNAGIENHRLDELMNAAGAAPAADSVFADLTEQNSGVFRFTAAAMALSPSGSGSSPFSATDAEQIRQRLGIDGTKSSPASSTSELLPTATFTAALPTNFGDLAITASDGYVTTSGGGGGGSFTTTEIQQIRYRLGLDGTKDTPSAAPVLPVSLATTEFPIIADNVLRRNTENARASSNGDAVSQYSLLGAIAMSGVNKMTHTSNTITAYHGDGTTSFFTRTSTTTSGADPITALDV